MNRQRGEGILGVLSMVASAVVVVVLAIKLIPAYTEYSDIKRELSEIARDPDLSNASGPEIRNAFSKKASIDNVSSISASDLEIDRNPFRLHVKYTVKIPVVANYGIYVDYDVTATNEGK